MLSWDDYEEQITPEPSAQAGEAIMAEAVKRQLDAQDQQASMPQPVEPPPQQQAAPAEPAATLASAALAPEVMPVQEDSGNTERVTVDQKAMINCRADLNQLVPFKYEWAWQKYLDGCANH